MYRAHRATQSGSAIYQAVREQPKPRNLYADSRAYQGLESYASAPMSSKYDQGNLSDVAYTQKLKPLLQHILEELQDEPELLQRIADQYNAALQRVEGGQTHEQLGEHLDSRTTGTGVGLGGVTTPRQRAQALGSRWGGRDVQANGHLVSHVPSTPGQPSLSMLSRLPKQEPVRIPQRTDISSMRSSGEGWTAR
jgi:hypothetical protein